MEAKIVAVCALLTWVVRSDGRLCTANQREYVYTRYGRYQELQCCEHDHAELLDTLWYKYDEESQSWELLALDTTDILLLERNATLAIKHAQFSDAGRYKCARTAVNSFQLDNFGTEFDLKVVACDQLARGPFPIAPLPCDVTSAKVGDHVTIPCTGYFGCDQDDVRMVSWYMKAKASDNNSWTAVSAADNRITQTQIDNHDGVLASKMTVSNVEVRDAELEFMCILFSEQYLEGQTNVFTSLSVENDNEEVADPLILLAVIVISVAVAATIVVAVTLRTMYYCRKLKSASDGNVRDVKRFIHVQNVTTDEVKPCLV